LSYIEAWRNGQVVRKHTMENIRAENDAEHTWGLTMLLICAWPNVPEHIIKMAIIHDCGERATGDMPGPTKWANPVLGDEMDRLEKQHIMDTLPEHLCDDYKTTTESEWAVIEFFDRAEFCISMARERRLGNTYAMIYMERSYNKMTQTFDNHKVAFTKMDTELLMGMMDLRAEIRTEMDKLERGDFKW